MQHLLLYILCMWIMPVWIYFSKIFLFFRRKTRDLIHRACLVWFLGDLTLLDGIKPSLFFLFCFFKAPSFTLTTHKQPYGACFLLSRVSDFFIYLFIFLTKAHIAGREAQSPSKTVSPITSGNAGDTQFIKDVSQAPISNPSHPHITRDNCSAFYTDWWQPFYLASGAHITPLLPHKPCTLKNTFSPCEHNTRSVVVFNCSVQ